MGLAQHAVLAQIPQVNPIMREFDHCDDRLWISPEINNSPGGLTATGLVFVFGADISACGPAKREYRRHL